MTTPQRRTTFLCLNCPMMAASDRSERLASSVQFPWRTLIATGSCSVCYEVGKWKDSAKSVRQLVKFSNKTKLLRIKLKISQNEQWKDEKQKRKKVKNPKRFNKSTNQSKQSIITEKVITCSIDLSFSVRPKILCVSNADMLILTRYSASMVMNDVEAQEWTLSPSHG